MILVNRNIFILKFLQKVLNNLIHIVIIDLYIFFKCRTCSEKGKMEGEETNDFTKITFFKEEKFNKWCDIDFSGSNNYCAFDTCRNFNNDVKSEIIVY